MVILNSRKFYNKFLQQYKGNFLVKLDTSSKDVYSNNS